METTCGHRLTPPDIGLAGARIRAQGKPIPFAVRNNAMALLALCGKYTDARVVFNRNILSALGSAWTPGSPVPPIPASSVGCMVPPRRSYEQVAFVFNGAKILDTMGEFLGAEQLYAALFRDFPQYVDAPLALAQMYQRQQSLSSAFVWAKAALQANPNSPEARNVIASILLEVKCGPWLFGVPLTTSGT